MELDGEDLKDGSNNTGNSKDGWIRSPGAGSGQTAARTEAQGGGARARDGILVALALLWVFMVAAASCWSGGWTPATRGGKGERDEGALLLGGLDSAGRSDSRALLLPPKMVTGGRGERRREDGGSGGDGREGHARAGELLSLAMRVRVCEAAGVGTRRRGSR